MCWLRYFLYNDRLGSKCYVNVLSCALLSTSLGSFLRKVIEALFLAAGGFDGFVVGLDDVCLVDDAGEAPGFGVFHDGNADANEFFDDFKALVEVCIFG